MNIDDLTLGQARELSRLFDQGVQQTPPANAPHPMLGRRCVIRTYSAGVHVGTVAWVNPNNSMELILVDGFRLWRWMEGGLSLSAIAQNGVKKARINRTKEVFLTNAIEYIPTNDEAEKTYETFIED